MNLLSGLDVSWFLAASPINRSPSVVNATYDGVIRFPWSLAMISTRPFLKMPTQEYVVPRSIPITVPISSVRIGKYILLNMFWKLTFLVFFSGERKCKSCSSDEEKNSEYLHVYWVYVCKWIKPSQKWRLFIGSYRPTKMNADATHTSFCRLADEHTRISAVDVLLVERFPHASVVVSVKNSKHTRI